ncbi:MAG: SAM-dependent methyltransferase [Micavibrio aeruginosavorus]|uniref:SAM-dependent methyltransferase n=1 Tax=Micavibrio aeruginosavorus TaxID=349221 RepID=A0A2W5Q327_9BACT|nr:MAG: SAM-dependent methyltransferase [Micavibrio aeruginosavorus]
MLNDFLKTLQASVNDGTFVKLALGGYIGGEPDLKKIAVRKVVIKREDKLSFTYSYKTRDIVKNYAIGEASEKIADFLQNGFKTATLFTTAFDLSYPAMKRAKASIETVPSSDHDQAKKRLVQTAGKQYLQDLKITDAKGEVFKNAQDKYRQIDKYIEILSGLLKDIPPEKIKKIVDMGAGKGYLTFALYDYLNNKIRVDARVIGVEYRQDLVDLCSSIAKKSAFSGLEFVQGTVENYDAAGTNVLIALHACDTATDDAIYKGITAGAELIVVAPCCHKQIRRQIEAGKKQNDLDFLMKHGIFVEREAEMVTDALRALLLEYAGYSVKVFEFISDSHTPKNVMIVASKNAKANPHNHVVLEKIKSAKNYFGIDYHHLERMMGI